MTLSATIPLPRELLESFTADDLRRLEIEFSRAFVERFTNDEVRRFIEGIEDHA